MTTQHDSTYSWIRLATGLGLSIVTSIALWAVVVVLPEMQSEFGLSRGNASLPYVLTMIGFAAGNVILGPAVDRWGIAPVLGGAAVPMALGYALSAATGSVVVVSALHLVLGLGAAAGFAPLIADISQWFLRRRGIAVAIAACGSYLSGAISPPVIAWIMAGHGWRGAYLFLAGLVILVVVPGAFLLRRRIDAASTARATSAAAARAETIRLSPRALQALLVIAGVACCVAMSMPQVHIVALCADRGYGARAGAEMLSLMLGAGVVSRLGFGALADRLGGLRTLLISSGLQMITLCLFLLQGGLTSLYLVSFVFGLSQGGIVSAYPIIVREYMPPREAGRRVGVVMAATVAGMALGGWLSGWLYDLSGSYALAVWNGVAWNVLNVGIALTILTRTGAPRQHPAPA